MSRRKTVRGRCSSDVWRATHIRHQVTIYSGASNKTIALVIRPPHTTAHFVVTATLGGRSYWLIPLKRCPWIYKNSNHGVLGGRGNNRTKPPFYPACVCPRVVQELWLHCPTVCLDALCSPECAWLTTVSVTLVFKYMDFVPPLWLPNATTFSGGTTEGTVMYLNVKGEPVLQWAYWKTVCLSSQRATVLRDFQRLFFFFFFPVWFLSCHPCWF